MGHPVSVSCPAPRQPDPGRPGNRAAGAYQLSSASITPWDRGAISANVAVARSIDRAVSASRSLTTQVTDSPLAGLVIRTTVPKGSHGLAQVPAGWS